MPEPKLDGSVASPARTSDAELCYHPAALAQLQHHRIHAALAELYSSQPVTHHALPEAAWERWHRSSTGVAGRCWSCMWLGLVVVPTEQAATRSGTAAALSCVTQLIRISKPSWRVDGHATITLRWHRPSSLSGSSGHERPWQWWGCHQHHRQHLQ